MVTSDDPVLGPNPYQHECTRDGAVRVVYSRPMRVIDARSGRELKVGDIVDWGDGERLTLIDVEPGWFSASAVIETVERDLDAQRLVTRRMQVPLQVRFTHPAFFLQHVAFINS